MRKKNINGYGGLLGRIKGIYDLKRIKVFMTLQ